MSPAERVAAIQAAVARQRSSMTGGGLMGGFANVVNLLPTSVTTRAARRQSARIAGPVAGAAMIVSALSYVDTFSVLMTVDPVAIPDAPDLRADVERAFEELLDAGS
jgi:hypothetical protein